jgi:hypothetical protein
MHMQHFLITIGAGTQPRARFPVMAEDSVTATQRHIEMAGADKLDVRAITAEEAAAIRTAVDAIKARTQAAWLGSEA